MPAKEHYFTENQRSIPKEREFSCRLRGHQFRFFSASGTFAKYRVDAATRLLIEHAEIPEDARILDLGCGIGIIGIVMARVFNSSVTMVEINERAAALAKKNTKFNRVADKVTVLQGNLYEPIIESTFDAILANPPMAAGRELCYSIIDKAPEHLKKGGTLQIVARHGKGGAMLEARMKERFGNCRTLAKKGGFRVYCSTRNLV